MQLQRTARLLPPLAPAHLLIPRLDTSGFGKAPGFVGLQNDRRVLTGPPNRAAA